MNITDLTPELQKKFIEMIDDVVIKSNNYFDEEMLDGFKIMGEESFRRNITLYDLILEAYTMEELEKTIEKWQKDSK